VCAEKPREAARATAGQEELPRESFEMFYRPPFSAQTSAFKGFLQLKKKTDRRGNKITLRLRPVSNRPKGRKLPQDGMEKAAFYVEALKCIIQAEKMALILHE